MFNKLFFGGLLCLGVLGFTAAGVYAYPATTGGWGAWPGSVTIWSDWKGVADYEKKPTDLTVTILFLEVQVQYINPGGNDGGLGEPFYPDAELSYKEGLGQGQDISKNGRFFSEVPFTDEEILAAIEDDLPEPPNPKWQPDSVTVLRMHVTIEGFSDWDGDSKILLDTEVDLDGDGEADGVDFSDSEYAGEFYCDGEGFDWGTEATSPTVYVSGTCELNYDHTAYFCNPEIEWYWKSNDPECPVLEDNNPEDDLDDCEYEY